MLLCMILLLVFPSCSSDGDNPHDKIIYYNIENEPVTLDPQIANDAGARLVILNIFEGLVRLDSNGNTTPGVAESWTSSNDHTVFTFHLRKDACWNDGTPLTAEDFVYGITRTLSPSTSSSTAPVLFCIKNAESFNNGTVSQDALGIRADDAHTVTFELEYSYEDFPSLLTSPCAMPCSKSFFESTAGQYGLESDKILSNGAFMLRKSYGWNHYENLTLRTNEYYNGESEPVPAGVDITIGDAPEKVFEAMQEGIIDCYALPGEEIEQAREAGFHITSFDDTVWGLCFNTENESVSNKNIRLGLLYALNREYILKKLPPNSEITNDIIPSTAELDGKNYRSLAGSNLCITYSDKCRSLLAQGLKEIKADTLPSIEILCADDDATQSIVNNIIETLNTVTGCYINKKPVPRSQLQDYIDNGNYCIALAPINATGNTPVNTLSLFQSQNHNNPARLKSTEYDEYINRIQENPFSESLSDIILAEKYLNDNGIFYPLYIESRFYASVSNVTGILFHAYGAEADFLSATKQNEASEQT